MAELVDAVNHDTPMWPWGTLRVAGSNPARANRLEVPYPDNPLDSRERPAYFKVAPVT